MLGGLIDELKKRRERLRDELENTIDGTDHVVLVGKSRMLREILQLVVDAERKLHQEQ